MPYANEHAARLREVDILEGGASGSMAKETMTDEQFGASIRQTFTDAGLVTPSPATGGVNTATKEQLHEFVVELAKLKDNMEEGEQPTVQEKIKQGSTLMVKDVEQLSDAALGKYVRKRMDALVASRMVSLSLFGDPEQETVDGDIEAEGVDPDTSDPQTFEQTHILTNIAVFKVGTHNGTPYTIDDLDHMVKNFSKLTSLIKPVLKLGHGGQKFLKAEGMPAAGWATKLCRVGDTLFADFKDVPKRIFELLKKKAYKRISAEIYPNFKDGKGTLYGMAFAGAAMLGADYPAIKSLPDIEALYNAEHDRNEIDVVEVTFDDDKGGEEVMPEEVVETPKDETVTEPKPDESEEPKEEESKVEEETVEPEPEAPETDKEGGSQDMTPELAAKLAEQAEELKGLKGIIALQQADLKAEKTKGRKEVEQAFLETLKSDGRWLPANDSKAMALFDALHEQPMVKLSEADTDGQMVETEKSPYALLKELFQSSPVLVNFDEVSTGPDGQKVSTFKVRTRDGETPLPIEGEEILEAINKYQEAHPGISYSDAYLAVYDK